MDEFQKQTESEKETEQTAEQILAGETAQTLAGEAAVQNETAQQRRVIIIQQTETFTQDDSKPMTDAQIVKAMSPDPIEEKTSADETPTDAPVKKKKYKLSMKGRGNRYYAFRNMNRLKWLNISKGFFSFTFFLSVVALAVGVATILLWLLLNLVVFLFMFMEKWQKLLDFSIYPFLIGGCLMAGSIIMKILLERIFFAVEKRDLKKNPEGADKYLAIMRVNLKADIINIIMWGVVAAAIGVGYATKVITFGAKFKITINNDIALYCIAGTLLLVLLSSRIIFGRIYNGVAEQIAAVKKERRDIQKAESELS